MTPIESLDPNRFASTPGDRFIVKTETHDVTVEVRRVGPETKGYHLAFVSSEPPIAESDFYEGEIIVNHDEIVKGEMFELNTLFPILTKTAFLALDIQPVTVATTSK